MDIHRILFPNCNLRELELAQAKIVDQGAVIKKLQADLKAEVTWNRRLADRMVNFGLTKSGQFGIEPRVAEIEQPATNIPEPVIDDDPFKTDERLKEERIQFRMKELAETYGRRGRNVPPEKLREIVEKNLVFLEDDDQIEL